MVDAAFNIMGVLAVLLGFLGIAHGVAISLKNSDDKPTQGGIFK